MNSNRASNGLKNNENSHDVGNSIREFLIGLSRRDKQLVAFGVDLIGFTLCACVTEWLLYGSSFYPYPVVSLECIAVALVAVLLAWSQGLYRSIVRYMGLDLYIAGAKAAAGSALIGSALMYFLGMAAAPVKSVVQVASSTTVSSGAAPLGTKRASDSSAGEKAREKNLPAVAIPPEEGSMSAGLRSSSDSAIAPARSRLSKMPTRTPIGLPPPGTFWNS